MIVYELFVNNMLKILQKRVLPSHGRYVSILKCGFTVVWVIEKSQITLNVRTRQCQIEYSLLPQR